MKERRQPYYLILIMPIFYVLLSVVLAKLIQNNGAYPSGIDTLAHIYKGDVLYHSAADGNFFPLYHPLWYNGMQTLRYQAPLPIYLLALCQFLGGGNPMYGYLVFVALLFVVGAVAWLYVGFKVQRPIFGAFLGILWFFMPNNLYVLIQEGNLPRALSNAFLPLLMYFIYRYLQEKRWYTFAEIAVSFALVSLCQPGYAGLIVIAFVIYFAVYAAVSHEWQNCVRAMAALASGYLLAGVWLIPYLMRSTAAAESTEVLKDFFQDMFLTINPAARFQSGCVDFYFGLAALLLAVFGMLLSKKKSMPGFWTAAAILIGSSNTLHILLSSLPGGQALRMLCLISIALCMVLFSFLIWDTLKKGWIVLFSVLLVLDTLPSLPLVLAYQSGEKPEDILADYADWTLIEQAKEITNQRLAVVDESALNAMGSYLATGFGNPIAISYGAAGELCATAANFTQIERALEEGEYPYVFDRCLELGNDTVIVRMDIVGNLMDHPIKDMDKAAARLGYRMVNSNDNYRLYHHEMDGNWGTVSKYPAVGIGSATAQVSRQFPVVEEMESDNLNDYKFEDLCDYQLIFLAGFTYDDKPSAEALITKLSEAGVRIVIAADGIPDDRGSQNQSFLGAVCNGVVFSQGYPDLDTIDGLLETDLFPDGYREWNTVYLDNLDKVWGTVKNVDWELPFYGTVKNDNIIMIGLNLTYYYGLTEDESIGQLLSHAMDISSDDLPEREIVPYSVAYGQHGIVINSEKADINTGLAYHDSFKASQPIYSQNHLMFVGAGETVISLTYPYLEWGILVSLAAALLIIVYTFFTRAQEKKAEKETE